ncbi:Hypothetical predicted protein [Octopus vulgaris]|uniref:Uncharacterized protein n=1 Tax=Octopus vulgaris TaxID=6645 RepID=A0AA36ALH8_OCTVU|nr:Hypothetical predicted protein [Octopus vulgaris]
MDVRCNDSLTFIKNMIFKNKTKNSVEKLKTKLKALTFSAILFVFAENEGGNCTNDFRLGNELKLLSFLSPILCVVTGKLQCGIVGAYKINTRISERACERVKMCIYLFVRVWLLYGDV